MKRIYLHIGRGKTGTSAIQAFLAKSRADLRRQGVHYVEADGGSTGSGHQQFAKSFIACMPHYMTPAVRPEAVRQAVGVEILASACDTVLLSSENFPLTDVGAVADYFQALPVANIVKIILFARTQDELAESEYNQMVKLKRETRTPTAYVEQALIGADYFDEARKWEKHFGRDNIICRIYDGASNNVISAFMSCLLESGPEMIDTRSQIAIDYANESVGIKALCVARLLNLVDLDERDALYRKIFRQLAGSDMPAVLFDVEEAQRIRTLYAQSNERFTERYLGARASELGGRRYSDAERESLRNRIKALGLGL